MKTHSLIQGTPEWHAHRASHFNASDAPAMMGLSAYKTRTQLLHELHTGLTPDVDAATQRRFDDGHRFEALARPLAEEIIGEDLYPVTGSLERLSASFDGLNMAETIALEHKTLNAELRALMLDECLGSELPAMYRVQMEQQLLVSGAEKCLFMASKWDGDTLVEKHHCWYTSDADLRQSIIDGWLQFAADLATYVPSVIKEKPKAEAIDSLPALFIHAKGEITTSNMQEYGIALASRLESVRAIVLITDQDFSNAKEQAKVFREQREKLQAVKESMLSQTTTIGEAARMIDDWSEDLRLTALKIEKDVEKEDAAKKLAMVNAAKVKYTEHTAAIEIEIAPARLSVPAPDFAGAIKGKRNYSSMQDALDVALASGKIAADAQAKSIRYNQATYKANAEGFEFLFADLAQLLHKDADDFALVIQSRIDARKAAEAKAKAEAEVAKLAREQAEQDRLAEKASADAISKAQIAEKEPAPAPVAIVSAAIELRAAQALPDGAYLSPAAQALNEAQGAVRFAKTHTPPTLALGEISTRLGFNCTSAFLATLGFEATTVKAAKLFHAEDFPAICQALITHISEVQDQFEPVAA